MTCYIYLQFNNTISNSEYGVLRLDNSKQCTKKDKERSRERQRRKRYPDSDSTNKQIQMCDFLFTVYVKYVSANTDTTEVDRS
jgi:hypothetical protein